MRTTIDKAGRVVIPKPVRDELGLAGGEELDVVARDGRIELAVPPVEIQLERRAGVWVGVPEREQAPLTPDRVRDVLEQVRR